MTKPGARPRATSPRATPTRATPTRATPPRATARLEARVASLEKLLARARSVGTALRQVGMAVGTNEHIDDLLTLIVNTTTTVLEAERATLYLLDDGKLISRVKKGDELEQIVVELGQGIAGHVAETGTVVRVKDAYKDKRFDPAWDKKSGYRTQSILAVPLFNHRGKTIGVLQVLNKRGARSFTPYDTELLRALASQAAVSLDKEALFQRLRTRNEQLRQTTDKLERSLRDLEILYDLETAMGRAESVKDVARNAIGLTAKACTAAAGALLAEVDGSHTLYVVNMDDPSTVRAVVVQLGEGIAGRAMEQERLLHIDDPKKLKDPRRVRELLGLRVRSALAAPLFHEGRCVGALALYNHRGAGESFSDQDMALLKLVSANVSTELRVVESRRQRERAERLGSIGRLLSGVMHDLRTPLTVISGYMQLMEITEDSALRAEYGRTVREQFEIIAAMQRDLLAYARGETAMLVRKVYLGRFCESIANQHKPELAARAVDLVVDVQHNGVAYFDEGRLGRAVGNLVRNAIEAMEEQERGTLTITCAADDEDLVLSVSDTGPGIPKGIRSKLFEPFVTKGKKMGTGLGLANVKKIVEEHGGSVEVRSSQKGTTFEVRIPSAMRPHSLRRGEMIPISVRG